MAQPLALGETTPSRFRRSAMDLKPRPAPPVYQAKMRRITSTRSGVLGNRRTCSRSEPLTFWPRPTVRTGLPSGIEDQLLAVVGVADDLEERAGLVEVAEVVAVGRHAAGPPALVGQGDEPADDGLRKRGRLVPGGLLLEETQELVGGRAGEALRRVDDLDPGLLEEPAIVAHLVAGHAAEALDVPDQDEAPLAAARLGRVEHGQEALPGLARGAGDAVVDELGHDLEAVLGGVAEDLLALVAEGFLLAVGGAAQVDGRGDCRWVVGS